MTISGYQDSSTVQVLNKYIPVAAACGGMIIGLISIFSDLVGAIGSGTGILLAVSIIYGYYEKLVK
jgi:protein transport protein SEC61 subunit alpha